MQNLKIRVNSEAESKEAQELLFKLGYKDRKNWTQRNPIHESIQAWKDGEFTFSLNHNQVPVGFKEITLPELRAMVNPMKEYLMPSRNYEYILTDAREALEPHAEDWIAIPEGANYAYNNDLGLLFMPSEIGSNHPLLVWQRDQDEPFLTPECTLNDQHSEIEQVREQTIDATLAERQSTYGNFEDVAFVTENIMAILAQVRVNGLNDLPNTHRMALYMIASKMARIVNGDFNHLDSWHDIGGYAKLIEKLIKGE